MALANIGSLKTWFENLSVKNQTVLIHKANKVNKTFGRLIYASLVIMLLLFLALIAGIYIDMYYRGADGFSYLLGFPAFGAACLLNAWLRPEAVGKDPPMIFIRIVTYVFCIIAVGIYLSVQTLLLAKYCPDPAYLADHPVANEICTNGYWVLVSTIIYAAALIVAFIIVTVFDALILNAADDLAKTIKRIRKQQ